MGLVYWILYDVLKVAMWTFYRDIRVVGAEHVPRRRPVLICGYGAKLKLRAALGVEGRDGVEFRTGLERSFGPLVPPTHTLTPPTHLLPSSRNHGNMVMDPLVIGLTMPHQRQCHFWAMKELFHGALGALLLAVGAVPVDRKNKDNKLLFKETIETLKAGGAMALFPEGTSYPEPHILQLKDGASRAALEYAHYEILEQRRRRRAARGEADPAADAVEPPPTAEELRELDLFRTACIVPVGINYSAKHQWRSDVLVEYGPAIEIEDYVAEYFVEPKAAVKRLTERLYTAIRQLTVNAEDWCAKKDRERGMGRAQGRGARAGG